MASAGGRGEAARRRTGSRHTGFLVTRLPPRRPSPQEPFRVAALRSSLATQEHKHTGTNTTRPTLTRGTHTHARDAGERRGTPVSFLALHSLPAAAWGHGAPPRPRRRRRRRRRRPEGSLGGLRSGPKRQTGAGPALLASTERLTLIPRASKVIS